MIPTHLRPSLLVAALDSVLAQTLQPTRIVVSDDADDAATREVVSAAAARADVPIEYRPHRGGPGTAGSSRNAGAAGAGEDLIGFLDDDDLWEPTFLERSCARLEDAGADFAVAWLDHVVDEHRSPGMRMPQGLSAGDCYYPNHGMSGSNALYRRSALETVGGFDPALPVANDMDLLVRLLGAGLRYVVVEEPLVQQVGHPGEHLTTRSERRALGLIAYGEKHQVQMSPAQRRDIKRVVHAARRGRDRALHERAWHLAGQLWHTSPTRFVQGARSRLARNPDMFNRAGRSSR
ncbi:glycosyltransferase family 2 protein [Flexivirga sp. B27]